MLQVVNEELMSYRPMDYEDKETGKMYFKLKMLTSNKLLQPESTVRKDRNDRAPKRPEGRKNWIEMQDEKLVPVNREIIRISSPLKKIMEIKGEEKNVSVPLSWQENPMSINITNQTRFNCQVDIRCHEHGEDQANIYVVAFPFNGMIKPLEEDPKYRIYKAFIASSAKPFFFNNHKYRKILYMVIEPNKKLFDPEHKYHVNTIPITLESFALFQDRETGDKKTNHETFTLEITSADGIYVTNWTYETINEAVMMNVGPGTPLWTTFQFDPNKYPQFQKKPEGRPNRNGGPRRNNFKKKPQQNYTMEGNMLVTTNKHGIRKEIPMNQRRGNNNRNYNNNRGGYQDKDMSLDEMMNRSGMYDKKGNRGKRNGGRPNKGGNYNRNNRY